jgi:formylglycine-generating enzyme required for sulfatase activity
MISLLQPGTWLQGRYLIQRVLGQGGMGAVYLALDTRLGQAPVAVKENFDASPQAQAQFQREAIALAQLSHPNLPRVTDHFIEPTGRQYLVMEYIAGEDLETLVQQGGALPEAQVLAWADQLLDALAYLHSRPQPVIHRDIKPANIKLTPGGQVKLVDFGLVKFYDPANPHTATLVHGMGSPQYAPPEQFNPAGHTDARSDIYSLGATLYHLLTGQAPATATDRVVNPQALLPPRRINAAIAPATEVTILRAMELPINNRFQTASGMRQALQGVLPPSTPRSVRHPMPRQGLPAWSLWLAGAIIVGLVIVLLLTLNKQIPTQTVVTVVATAPIIHAVTSAPVVASTLGPTLAPMPNFPPIPTNKPTDVSETTLGTGSTRVSEKDSMVQVYVPAGEFSMGSSESDKSAGEDEKPQHTVYLDAFWIDRTEVINAMFKRFVAATGYRTEAEKSGIGRVFNGEEWIETPGADWQHPGGPATNILGLDNYPVLQVSWNDAQAYCQWTGRKLPTEAQWEKAARGRDGRIYPWGNQMASCNYAVMNDGAGNGCGKGSVAWPVGSKPKGASPYGAWDMAGNLWEWVADWYDKSYYASSPSKNPPGPSPGQSRVLRGGGWNNFALYVRVTNRLAVEPIYRDDNNGFRCVSPN